MRAPQKPAESAPIIALVGVMQVACVRGKLWKLHRRLREANDMNIHARMHAAMSLTSSVPCRITMYSARLSPCTASATKKRRLSKYSGSLGLKRYNTRTSLPPPPGRCGRDKSCNVYMSSSMVERNVVAVAKIASAAQRHRPAAAKSFFRRRIGHSDFSVYLKNFEFKFQFGQDSLPGAWSIPMQVTNLFLLLVSLFGLWFLRRLLFRKQLFRYWQSLS